MDSYHDKTNMEVNHRFPNDGFPTRESEKNHTNQSEREVRSVQGLDVCYTRSVRVEITTDIAAEIHSIRRNHCFRCDIAVLVGSPFRLIPGWTAEWRLYCPGLGYTPLHFWLHRARCVSG